MRHTCYIIPLLFSLIISLSGYSQNHQEKKLFTGGMYPNIGYISNDQDFAHVDGITTGIGGKLAFYITNHFRFGTEGYATTYNYPDEKGFYKLGWGGAVIEYYTEITNFGFAAGATIGAGSIKDLYLLDANTNDREPDEAIYEKQTFFVLAPNVSVEYILTEKIRFAIKTDYIIAPGRGVEMMTAKGPKLYFGILFTH